MEMVQAMPNCTVWPPSLRNSHLTYIMAEHGVGKLYNAEGERFMQRYDPRLLEHSTKEIVSVATALEIRAGRGSPHGGIYYNCEGTSREFKAILDNVSQYAEGSIQFKEGFPKAVTDAANGHVFEVADLMHYMMGGIRTDENGQCTVPGLFAGGECTGGLWGASRVSSAISEAVIQGRIAGRSAGRYARQAPSPDIDPEQVAAVKGRTFAPLGAEGGPAPFEVKKRVQDIAAKYIGLVKEGGELTQAIAELARIEERDLPRLTLSGAKSRLVNAEWTEALQLRDLMQVLKLNAVSALHREESRGSHYRLDATVMDNDRWLRNLVIRQSGDAFAVSEVPVVVTSLHSPKGRMTYEQANQVATASLSEAAGGAHRQGEQGGGAR